MPPASAHLRLRDFAAELESRGWLLRVDKPVEKDWEIACIGRWALESTDEDDAYAIRFDRVVGHDVPVVIGLFGSRRKIALSLGVRPDELWDRFSRALSEPIEPVRADDAPAREVVLRGEDADVLRLPVPVWTPGRDNAPYLSSACIVTADREKGIPNLATYRVQVQGSRRLGLFFGSEKQHGAMHWKTFEDRGEPMPIAFVLGAAPAVSYAAAAKLRYGVDEMTVAGGLAGRPIPVVPCETSDLLVPADAEIVIEGRVRPGERADEGPFGEALGYMEGVAPAPIVDVTCITHRRAPIFHGLVQQVPPSEGHLLMETGLVGSLWHYLRTQARVEGVVDLAIVPGAAGTSVLCASVRRGDRRAVAAIRRVMTLLNWGQKLVLIVDEDVDVRDPKSLFWALSSRVDFSKDVTTQADVPLFQRDPAAFQRAAEAPEADASKASKMIVDATIPCDCMDVSLPARSLMRRAREAWEATGLPPMTGVSRLERLLETHGEGGIEYRLPPSSIEGEAPR